MRQNSWGAAVLLALASLCGCDSAKVALEVFVVSPATDSNAVRYVKRTTSLARQSADPDRVAWELARGAGEPAILHSTSWRWERNGTIVLTYLAYCEAAEFHAANPVRMSRDKLGPPPATDPQHPRPPEIREKDVLAHGLRHLSFLIRYARDGRLAAALTPRSLAFFHALCGQLAGRIETAREFEECAAAGAR